MGYSPVGIELSYIEDQPADDFSGLELISLEVADIQSSEALSYERKATDLEDLNKYLVEVVMPDEKLPNVEDLIENPMRTLQIYEQYVMRHVQKNIPSNILQDTHYYVIVKGSKFVCIFLSVRRIMRGIGSTNSEFASIIEAPLGIVGLLEFVAFLCLLVWCQSRNNFGRVSKFIFIFLVVRIILVESLHAAGMEVIMKIVGSTLVQFFMFFLLLMWGQKRNSKIQRKVLRSTRPRKIDLSRLD